MSFLDELIELSWVEYQTRFMMMMMMMIQEVEASARRRSQDQLDSDWEARMVLFNRCTCKHRHW